MRILTALAVSGFLVSSGAGIASAEPRPLTVTEFATHTSAMRGSSAADFPGVNDFRAMIKLTWCSGSLIRFPNSQPSDPALLLTNGHCTALGSDKPNTTYVNKPWVKKASLYGPDGNTVLDMKTTRVLYAVRTFADTAIVELDRSYADIRSKAATDPLTLADHGPKVGDKITVNSSYWKKRYQCTVEKQVYRLKEAWRTWQEALRYANVPACQTEGGTSGSPIIDNATGLVVGINNTGADESKACEESAPCEVDENGKIDFAKGRKYGVQTKWLLTCWTDQRTFDTNKPGCMMPKP